MVERYELMRPRAVHALGQFHGLFKSDLNMPD